MPNPNTNSIMLDNKRSTKKKNTEANTAISKTVIVANIVSLLVAQVILFNSCLTCLTNCAGLVLDILHTAYTIGSPTLSAPQATLMKSVSDGVFTGNLPWNFVFIGGIIAIVLILIDLRQEKIGSDFRVPVLAVAVGIYLPITLTVPIFIGGMINHLGKKAGGSAKSEKNGLLMSSGFITGEALCGIGIAVPVFLTGVKDWWPTFYEKSDVIGVFVFISIIFWLYKTVSNKD